MNLIIKDERFSKLIKSLQLSAQTVNDKLCLIVLSYLIDVFLDTWWGCSQDFSPDLVTNFLPSDLRSGVLSSLSAFTLVQTQGTASDVMSQISPFEWARSQPQF